MCGLRQRECPPGICRDASRADPALSPSQLCYVDHRSAARLLRGRAFTRVRRSQRRVRAAGEPGHFTSKIDERQLVSGPDQSKSRRAKPGSDRPQPLRSRHSRSVFQVGSASTLGGHGAAQGWSAVFRTTLPRDGWAQDGHRRSPIGLTWARSTLGTNGQWFHRPEGRHPNGQGPRRLEALLGTETNGHFDAAPKTAGHSPGTRRAQAGHKAKRRPRGRRFPIHKLLLLFENFGCGGKMVMRLPTLNVAGRH
jgi:hypothetical protein